MYARQLGASIELAQHELPHLAVDIFERRDLFIVDVPLVRIRRVPHLIAVEQVARFLRVRHDPNGLFGESAFYVTCMQARHTRIPALFLSSANITANTHVAYAGVKKTQSIGPRGTVDIRTGH
jgi:hypothetical protein